MIEFCLLMLLFVIIGIVLFGYFAFMICLAYIILYLI